MSKHRPLRNSSSAEHIDTFRNIAGALRYRAMADKRNSWHLNLRAKQIEELANTLEAGAKEVERG